LAEKILELTNSRSQIEVHPLPEDDPKQRKPDITKARDYLGWEPAVQLENGLIETIRDFQSRMK
jgi:UDP-glucuronate decarboxylase